MEPWGYNPDARETPLRYPFDAIVPKGFSIHSTCRIRACMCACFYEMGINPSTCGLSNTTQSLSRIGDEANDLRLDSTVPYGRAIRAENRVRTMTSNQVLGSLNESFQETWLAQLVRPSTAQRLPSTGFFSHQAISPRKILHRLSENTGIDESIQSQGTDFRAEGSPAQREERRTTLNFGNR
ncbi:hypothetical protein BDV96DRAFT_153950 [Lophiotrema nucula]|uniref:Uncharacterized protein n=1 Tax=Lophiotrema nucula TaxID=690887 RepID=A0A6A5Z2S3_9PLEO|nr:hypothetical protein BDV96DRAFT_153950 [Lophiotrema nucula]